MILERIFRNVEKGRKLFVVQAKQGQHFSKNFVQKV